MSTLRRGVPSAIAAISCAVGSAVLYFTDPDARKYADSIILPYRNRWVERSLQHRKPDLFNHVDGNVVLLGASTGNDVPYLDGRRITDVTAVEPEERYHAVLRDTLNNYGYPTAAIAGDDPLAYLSRLPSGSVSAVVSCSALSKHTDPEAVLAQVHRVLKPSGRLFFVEPSSMPGFAESIQQAWATATRPLTGQNTPKTAELITKQFGQVYMEDWSSSVDRTAPRKGVSVITHPKDTPPEPRISRTVPAYATTTMHDLFAKRANDAFYERPLAAPVTIPLPEDPVAAAAARREIRAAHPAHESLFVSAQQGRNPFGLRPLVAGYALRADIEPPTVNEMFVRVLDGFPRVRQPRSSVWNLWGLW